MTSDRELLSRYLGDGDEAAFTELVDRYLVLVRGIAWRQSGRAELVDDISMAVFAALARKAGALVQRDSFASWLTLATRLQTAEALRREDSRRRLMKSLANESVDSSDPVETIWDEAATHIDDALAHLPERDREAVLLHFYHRLPFREIGRRFGRGEDAARKRVGKALRRMESFFRRRGIAFSSAVIAAGLSERLIAHTIGSATSATIAKGALAASAGAVPTSFTTSLLMAMTLQKTWIPLTIALTLACLSTGAGYLAGQHQGNRDRVSLLVKLAAPKQASSEKAIAIASQNSISPAAEPLSIKALIDQIATLALEVSDRPSAVPELASLRKNLPPDQFEEALRISRNDYSGDPDLQARLISYVLIEWADHDARAATEAVAASAEKHDQLEGQLTITLPAWGKSNPQEAIDWVRENGALLGGGAGLRLNASVFSGWCGTDPVGALNAFETLDYDQQRQITESFGNAVKDASTRESFARRLGKVEDEKLRVEILERSVIRAISGEPAASVAVFDRLHLTDPGLQWRAMNAVADPLYANDPGGTVQWLWDRAPESRQTDILTNWVSLRWAQSDRPAAAAWLEAQGYDSREWLANELGGEEQP